MTRLGMRGPSVKMNGEPSLFVDTRKKKHSYFVDLMIEPKTGEVKGALVVEAETDREWQLIGVEELGEKVAKVLLASSVSSTKRKV